MRKSRYIKWLSAPFIGIITLIVGGTLVGLVEVFKTNGLLPPSIDIVESAIPWILGACILISTFSFILWGAEGPRRR